MSGTAYYRTRQFALQRGVLLFLRCWSALVGWLSVLECAFRGFLPLFVLLHLLPLFRLFVTKRCNRGNRCNSANNSRKPQKAHSKTESQPTSADQQHKNRRTRTRTQAAGDGNTHRAWGRRIQTTHTVSNRPECKQTTAPCMRFWAPVSYTHLTLPTILLV